MRKMAILATFVAVASATAVHAQGERGPGRGRGGPGGPGPMMDRVLLQGITLTDAQKASLTHIREAEREKMQAEGGPRGRGDFEAMRTARQNGDTATVQRLMAEERATMDARRDAQATAIRAILTADQVTQFDTNLAELKKREAERGPGLGGPGGRGGRRGGPPTPPPPAER